MQVGRPLFSQVMDFVPWASFDRLVEKYGGDKNAARLRCAVQFRAMAFAQMTFRESLRDIEASLNAHPPKLYGMGFRHPVAKSTLADANEKRDWRMWHDLAVILIRRARKLYAHDDIGLDLDNTVYALDSTTIYEGSGQDAHADRFAWADPQFYPCFQRYNGRCAGSGLDRAGGRSHLCHGSRPCRFSAAVWFYAGWYVLRHPRQGQYEVSS